MNLRCLRCGKRLPLRSAVDADGRGGIKLLPCESCGKAVTPPVFDHSYKQVSWTECVAELDDIQRTYQAPSWLQEIPALWIRSLDFLSAMDTVKDDETAQDLIEEWNYCLTHLEGIMQALEQLKGEIQQRAKRARDPGMLIGYLYDSAQHSGKMAPFRTPRSAERATRALLAAIGPRLTTLVKEPESSAAEGGDLTGASPWWPAQTPRDKSTDPASRSILDQVSTHESLDGGRYLGQLARDHGSFGSMSLYDGYGDEDMP